MRQGLRFSPPSIEVPTEVDWLLLRALGREFTAWDETKSLDPKGLSELVGAVGLLGRVRARWPRENLGPELGAGLLEQADRAIHRIAANELLQERGSSQIAVMASEEGEPSIFLKGLALRLGGHSIAGARHASDIDVLVPRDAAGALHSALVEQGSVEHEIQPQDHHLPPLEHPQGAIVEIHVDLRGVNLEGERAATAEECLSSGRCRVLEGWPEGTHIPEWSLLIAHLLVHGLGQHGFSPGAYPLLQLLADLQDLDFSGDQGDLFLAEGYGWIKTEVTREEVVGTRDLLRRLEEGDQASDIVAGETAPAVILRHMLAGSLNTEYRQSLKLAAVTRTSIARQGLMGLLRNLGSAVVLTRGQIDVIYGKPKTEFGYLGRRLWRPFDLMGRTIKTLQAQRKLRLRQ